MENVPGAELNETAQNDAARKERESQAAVLYCSAGLAIVAALIWTLLGLAVTMGAAILFLAGMALLIWALFDSDHKLAGYIVMGCWFALGVFGLVIGQRNRPRVLPGPAEIIWHRSTEAGHDVEEHAFACDTPVTVTPAEAGSAVTLTFQDTNNQYRSIGVDGNWSVVAMPFLYHAAPECFRDGTCTATYSDGSPIHADDRVVWDKGKWDESELDFAPPDSPAAAAAQVQGVPLTSEWLQVPCSGGRNAAK